MSITNGKWSCDRYGVVTAVDFASGLAETICTTPQCFAESRASAGNVSDDVREYMRAWRDRCIDNGRLIAASRCLLEAAQEVVRRVELFERCDNEAASICRILRAAIEKATEDAPCDVA